MSSGMRTGPNLKLPLLAAFVIQCRVVGALLMRELHTRYGRENIGYLWLIGEPLMLGTVMSVLHGSESGHGGEIHPAALTVVGYCNFIMFRGIVNRSEGALEANLPLLYHRMVTVFDIVISRALLEAAGTTMSFSLLYIALLAIGITDLPARPLYMFAGIAYIFVFSTSISLIIIGGSHDKSFLERMIHPFTYFMIPLSGAFYQVGWLPEPYRSYLMWNPFPHMFEILRYGVFESATLEYVSFEYTTAFCMILLILGLALTSSVRRRIHLH